MRKPTYSEIGMEKGGESGRGNSCRESGDRFREIGRKRRRNLTEMGGATGNSTGASQKFPQVAREGEARSGERGIGIRGSRRGVRRRRAREEEGECSFGKIGKIGVVREEEGGGNRGEIVGEGVKVEGLCTDRGRGGAEGKKMTGVDGGAAIWRRRRRQEGCTLGFVNKVRGGGGLGGGHGGGTWWCGGCGGGGGGGGRSSSLFFHEQPLEREDDPSFFK